jgi:hypothetical protein
MDVSQFWHAATASADSQQVDASIFVSSAQQHQTIAEGKWSPSVPLSPPSSRPARLQDHLPAGQGQQDVTVLFSCLLQDQAACEGDLQTWAHLC